MISIEDREKIQAQQRLDTVREVLEHLDRLRIMHHSDYVSKEVKGMLSALSIQFIGTDIFNYDDYVGDEE